MQKIYRLASSASFNFIHRKGKKVSNNLLIIASVTAYNLKIGISVSKKVGNSVVRSKVKRRIKEAFRILIPTVDHLRNYVVIAKEGCATATYDAINTSLLSLLLKFPIKTA